MQNPIKTVRILQSQFMLKFTEYRDQNLYIRINDVETNDNRQSLFEISDKYRYIDFTAGPGWIGPSEIWVRNVSRDDGKTFKPENQLIIYGTYFFMSNDIAYQSRTVYNLLTVISDFGGIMEILTFVFMVSCTAFNDQQLVAKSIRSLFFQKNSRDANSKFLPIKFKLADKFQDLCCVKWRRKPSDSQIIFTKGSLRIREEFNIFMIVQSIQKLKAAVAALINRETGPE